MKKRPPRNRNKKIARNHGNVNWLDIRCNAMDGVNQAFGTNKVEIKVPGIYQTFQAS
jgi:hypothetical protein